MARRPRGALREEILAAAAALLREREDVAAVSIDAVVNRVGCTPPSLYYYYPTKDALVLAACRREYEHFAADLESATPRTDDVAADLLARAEAYLAWARSHPAQYRFLFLTPLDLPQTGPNLPDLTETPGLGELVAEIVRAEAAGYRLGDPVSTAFSFWAVVHGFASLAITEAIPPEFTDPALRRTLTALLAGLTREQGPETPLAGSGSVSP